MKEEDFSGLKYQKIIINGNKAKILLNEHMLMIVTPTEKSDVIFTIFKDKELVLAHHLPLTELINRINEFKKEEIK